MDYGLIWPMGIPNVLQRLLTVPCTGLTAGKLPAVRAVQGDCETVLQASMSMIGIILKCEVKQLVETDKLILISGFPNQHAATFIWPEIPQSGQIFSCFCLLVYFLCWSWWHGDIGTLSVLLALCVGNPSVTGGFPAQGVNNAVCFSA